MPNRNPKICICVILTAAVLIGAAAPIGAAPAATEGADAHLWDRLAAAWQLAFDSIVGRDLQGPITDPNGNELTQGPITDPNGDEYTQDPITDPDGNELTQGPITDPNG